MMLKVMGIIEAEGTALDLAMYTHTLLEIFRIKHEFDKKRDVEEWMEKFGDMTFEELMRKEREDEE